MGQFAVFYDLSVDTDEQGNPIKTMNLYPNPAHDQLTLEGVSKGERDEQRIQG